MSYFYGKSGGPITKKALLKKEGFLQLCNFYEFCLGGLGLRNLR